MSVMPPVSPHKILIPEPEAGGALQFTIQPAQVYVLGFAPETSTIEKDGQDVRVLCENGGGIVLFGFFSAISQADITLELKDGTLLSGQDLADVLVMSLKDFRTNGQQSPDVADVADTSGLVAQEQGSSVCLRLEDVLDTSPSALFEDAPTKIVVATNFVSPASPVPSPQAGAISPDDDHTAMQLFLQRMDM